MPTLEVILQYFKQESPYSPEWTVKYLNSLSINVFYQHQMAWQASEKTKCICALMYCHVHLFCQFEKKKTWSEKQLTRQVWPSSSQYIVNAALESLPH